MTQIKQYVANCSNWQEGFQLAIFSCGREVASGVPLSLIHILYVTVINTDLQRKKSKWINKIALKVAQSKVDLNNFQD